MGGVQTSDVRCAGASIDSASDLEWMGIANYGTDSEAGYYPLNREGVFYYGEIGGPTEIDAYEVFGKENLIRTRQGKETRTLLNNFGAKCAGPSRKRVSVK